MTKPLHKSLKRSLLIRLWGPLLLVMVLGSAGSFLLAKHIGSFVYDRWLYDSAMTLATQVKFDDGRATLEVPPSAIQMFEWDSVDHIFEEVVSSRTGHLFGNVDFPQQPPGLGLGKPVFYEGHIKGRSVRVVALRIPNTHDPNDTVLVQVAETKEKRRSLAADIVVIALPLQLFILTLAGLSVWFAVTSGLREVDAIAANLADYDPVGLEPVSDVAQAPREVRPLLNPINRLISKLAEAQDMQSRFIANAAHQLRTPLAALQVQTERALREPDPARYRDALSHVLNAVTRSRHLTHQLLTLARSEPTGAPMLEMVRVDLAALAREEVERWADQAMSWNVDLGYDGPERDIFLLAEPLLLRELISNLIDNAIRYGRPNGVVTLGLSGGLTASPIVLTVDDDGTGVPAEESLQVFERFYRRRGTSGDGCGLGLAIVREIATRHNASVILSDRPQGGGMRVEIRFVSEA